MAEVARYAQQRSRAMHLQRSALKPRRSSASATPGMKHHEESLDLEDGNGEAQHGGGHNTSTRIKGTLPYISASPLRVG